MDNEKLIAEVFETFDSINIEFLFEKLKLFVIAPGGFVPHRHRTIQKTSKFNISTFLLHTFVSICIR